MVLIIASRFRNARPPAWAGWCSWHPAGGLGQGFTVVDFWGRRLAEWCLDTFGSQNKSINQLEVIWSTFNLSLVCCTMEFRLDRVESMLQTWSLPISLLLAQQCHGRKDIEKVMSLPELNVEESNSMLSDFFRYGHLGACGFVLSRLSASWHD